MRRSCAGFNVLVLIDDEVLEVGCHRGMDGVFQGSDGLHDLCPERHEAVVVQHGVVRTNTLKAVGGSREGHVLVLDDITDCWNCSMPENTVALVELSQARRLACGRGGWSTGFGQRV
jgi:hypothetical protein